MRGLNIFVKFLYLATGIAFMRAVYKPISDPDLWWHLASGRFMLENRLILKKEVFSYTLFGSEWINFEWLYQVSAYLIVKLAGLTGLFIWNYVLWLACLLMVFICLKKTGAGRIWSLVLMWIAFYVVSYRFDARAGIVTLILIPAFVYFVLCAKDKGCKYKKFLPLIFLALTILWSNWHGGFIYGLMLLFFCMLGARLTDDAEFRNLIDKIFTFSLIGSLINPFGFRLLALFAEMFFYRRAYSEYVAEWVVPAPGMFPFYWLLFALTVFSILLAVRRKFRELYFLMPAVLFFVLFSSFQARSTPLLVFTAVPFLGSFGRFSIFNNAATALKIAGAGICVVFVCVSLHGFKKPLMKDVVCWESLPVRACGFINKEDIKGNPFSTLRYGDYMTWAVGPEKKVFLYGSYLFFDLFAESEDLILKPPARVDKWQRYFEKYNVDYSLIPHSKPQFVAEMRKGNYMLSLVDIMFPGEYWALVYWDDNSLVFVKRSAKNDDLIKKFEYREIKAGNLDKLKYLINHKLVDKEAAFKELERHHAQAGRTRLGGIIKDLLKL